MCLSIFLVPQFVIPFLMFFPRYFSVFSGGVVALVTEVLLKKPKPVSGIIEFYCMYSECIPEFVRRNIMYPSCFWVYQSWQAGFLGTLFHYLPGPVAINAEDEPFPVPLHRPTTLDIFFEHGESLAINGQHSLATTFLLLGLSLLNLTATLWAEGMASAKPLPAPGARQLQAGFEMFDGNRATSEVHVFNRQSQSLADAATKME